MGFGVASMKSMINEKFLKETSMIIESPKRNKLVNERVADGGVNRLISKLKAPECKEFFYKVMYYLPESKRETILEYALRDGVTSPKRYFTSSAKRELAKLGIR